MLLIENINHASLKITLHNGLKLLFDPWYLGDVFEEGWGLKYLNQDAFNIVMDCDFLWISHFHSDHFHIPTLEKIFEVNPSIRVLCNDSYNFKFSNIIKKIGFKNIISFKERKEYQLCDQIIIKRFPTTGIDNMLLIKSNGITILNFNDCNIPDVAKKIIKKKIGHIDILLTNFNHAGKLFDEQSTPNESIKRELIETLKRTINIFNPKFTIPFASFHYYRAEESLLQNDSLLNLNDINSVHPSIIPLKVGCEIKYDVNRHNFHISSLRNVIKNQYTVKKREKSIDINTLKEVYKIFYKKINNGFFYSTFLLPSLNIKVKDLNVIIKLKFNKSEFEIVSNDSNWHVSVHSLELYNWWSKSFGTDSFFVGGHFDLNSDNFFPLRIRILLGLLVENKLDLKSIIKMFLNIEGWLFLLNRKEEIFAILFYNRFKFGSRN